MLMIWYQYKLRQKKRYGLSRPQNAKGHFLLKHHYDAVFSNDSSRPALGPNLCGCEYVPGWISIRTWGLGGYCRRKQDLQISGWSHYPLWNNSRFSEHVIYDSGNKTYCKAATCPSSTGKLNTVPGQAGFFFLFTGIFETGNLRR